MRRRTSSYAIITALLMGIAPLKAAEPTTLEEFSDLVGANIGSDDQVIVCPNAAAVARVLEAGRGRAVGSSLRVDKRIGIEKCTAVRGPLKVMDAFSSQTASDSSGNQEVVWYTIKIKKGSLVSPHALYGWLP